MTPTLSLLETASAIARHAGHVHAVTADNVARADMPGATAREAMRFADAVRAMDRRDALAPRDTHAPVRLQNELTVMATNAGRHDAAVLLWSKTMDMVRLAGASPR